jgi:glycerol-3-phosphate dehydrogenase
LRERGRSLNAPHLVRHLAFIVPVHGGKRLSHGVGLKIYDLLASKLRLRSLKLLSREETLAHLPTLEPAGLRGGTIYYDGQFDDARLAIALAQSAARLRAALLNYVRVIGLVKDRDLVRGVIAFDVEKSPGI